MPGKIQVLNAAPAPVPLLFFIADTGGGHRNAAGAVGQALDRRYPGRFAPVLTDPLGGQGSARLLAPWLWGAAYYASNSRPAMRLLRGALLRLADRPAIARPGRGPDAARTRPGRGPDAARTQPRPGPDAKTAPGLPAKKPAEKGQMTWMRIRNDPWPNRSA